MTISKERVIELARKAGINLIFSGHPDHPETDASGNVRFWSSVNQITIGAFVQAIRNEALGEAAVLCFKRAAYIGSPIDSAHVMKCGESIQKLKEQQ